MTRMNTRSCRNGRFWALSLISFVCKSKISKHMSHLPAGFYCPGGNNESRPSEYECQPGFYCPRNSSRMTPCDAGRFCNTPSMSEPGDLCLGGYYCPLQSTTAKQKDCPAGNFCPIGSKQPSPCDPGTFLPGENHVNKSECIECTAGMHCNRSDLSEPSGMCAEKYYCPPGQSSSQPTRYYCPRGHYCQVML